MNSLKNSPIEGMSVNTPIILITILLLLCNTACISPQEEAICEPYRPVSGAFTGAEVAQSPDPLVAFRWENPVYTDSLEIYTLSAVSVTANIPEHVTIRDVRTMEVTGACDLMFDFRQVNAAWLEFDCRNLDGDISASISEFNEPAVFNAGSENPVKTAVPVRYGNTYRLELNKQLYEGVRFAWIHIQHLNRPATITGVRLVCQIKPTNYEGSFACSDTMLTRAWYTGAYDVKLNLLHDYFGAILMERSDRHSWTGDAHPSQAASMVAFGNFDFVKANLRYTSTQFNGIASYSLYWVLSLIDYYNYTGDKPLLDEMLTNACNKLDTAYNHFGKNPRLAFYGWDERLGAGFENPNCAESQNAYKMLSIRAWNEFSDALQHAGYVELSTKYKKYVTEKTAVLRSISDWTRSLGVHAAADAVNAGFINTKERETLWENAFTDRLQRLSYSPFNQYFIIQALARMQRYDEALATIDDCWGGQIRYGGTTFFEVFRPSWNIISRPNDAPVNNQCGYTSLTHPWSAGITKWLSEEMLGVKPSTPGFKTFVVKPHLSAAVTWVKGTVPTPLGTIAFSFDAATGNGELTTPRGAQAIVAIPKAGRSILNVEFDNDRIRKHGEDEQYVYYEGFNEGQYRFTVNFSGDLYKPTTGQMQYAIRAAVTEDRSTHGNWKGKYGNKGYILCNFDSLWNRQSLPVFVKEIVFNKTGNIHWATATDDIRALQSSDAAGAAQPLPSDAAGAAQPSPFDSDAAGKTRNIGAIITRDPIPCDQTMTIDIHSHNVEPYNCSLYFVDWDRQNRRSAIEIFDLANKNLLMPVYMVRDYDEGKYVTFSFDRPVRIRINQVRGVNAALSGLFFD